MKIFYSVQYREPGMMAAENKWFDNLDEAKAFADNDYRDRVVVHSLKDPDKISRIEESIAEEKAYEKYYTA